MGEVSRRADGGWLDGTAGSQPGESLSPAAGLLGLGPGNGILTVRTFREGMAAMVGHDLEIEITRWQGELDIESREVRIDADPCSLSVRQGTGGAKPLTEKDRSDIKANLEKVLMVQRFPEILFRSTEVLGGDRLEVAGELTIAGNKRNVRFPIELVTSGGMRRVSGVVAVKQTDWGIKPYSAMLGALKVRDVVEVVFELEAPL